jgi:hypothetical protein
MGLLKPKWISDANITNAVCYSQMHWSVAGYVEALDCADAQEHNIGYDIVHVKNREEVEIIANNPRLSANSKVNILTHCRHVGIDIVRKYIRLPWDWERLTSSRFIPYKDIMNNPDLPWDPSTLKIKECIHKLIYTDEHVDVKKGNISIILFMMDCSVITDEIYRRFSCFDRIRGWYSNLIKYSKLSIETVIGDSHMADRLGEFIVSNCNITENRELLIDKYHNIITDWCKVSEAYCVSWEFIKSRSQYPWNPYSLVSNPNFPLSELLNHYYEHDIQDHIISSCPNITWDFIVLHPEIEWNFNSISSNCRNLNWQIIRLNKDIKWRLEYLSQNKYFKENKY